MHDVIEVIGQSVVHHGSYNDRAYLMKLHRDDCENIVTSLDTLALTRGYSKIFAKIPAWAKDRFLAGGYVLEAGIPGFFPGDVDACFLGKYFTEDRAREKEPQLVCDVLVAAREKAQSPKASDLPQDFFVQTAAEEHGEDMAQVYREVFASYPFPIHDAAFLRDAMKKSTLFFGVWDGNRIAALSSAEMDVSSGSAEMTDFATPPEYRGNGLALFLLRHMEDSICARGIRSLFTIARAYSYSMNITFARNGYHFGGTLTNNTNIFGKLESMNVWYKILQPNIVKNR
ncbi:MAG TPA: putative beta-lysine N-acetyltransferase [Geobacteraceae bacterium]|nr:putative beta-lysine N-acetyltransferase [Geobacteraceae bacterium]